MRTLFTQRLKELRNENELTQRAIAKMLGISQASYFNWELGKTEPSISSIQLLCSIFDTTADYLLGFENEDGSKIRVQINNKN